MANLDISDLPEKVRESLERAGLVSTISILTSSDYELLKQGNLSKEECELLKTRAAKSILTSGFIPVAGTIRKLEERWQRLSVGCVKLDGFLRGGVAAHGITEIAGESGSGKTQLCLQMTMTVQYPVSCGGFNGGAVYICTEDAFPSRRLHELFNSFPPTFSQSQTNISFGGNIFIEHIGDVESLKQCLFVQLPQLLTRHSIRLIVVDSIAGLFRADYEPSDAINRAKDLQIVGSQLHKLAEKFHMAVICVNQVTEVARDGKNNEIKQHAVPALGLAWANIVTTRLQLHRTARTVPDPHQPMLQVSVRTFEVVFAPHLP
ncbi:DNA repair protein XRCC3, partial [Zootermopsis nevadensis]|uniref:DNA repair protein XRCC3 n=1 Tax=Zootermopsis nevadensis TaxID=136037 RepID=UPI000B8E56FE